MKVKKNQQEKIEKKLKEQFKENPKTMKTAKIQKIVKNKWIDHVKECSEKHKLKYGDALRIAKKSYLNKLKTK
jgi:hypothetical protein